MSSIGFLLTRNGDKELALFQVINGSPYQLEVGADLMEVLSEKDPGYYDEEFKLIRKIEEDSLPTDAI